MPSTFLGLNTGLSGLNYFQASLNTTAHNVSNANTPGYSRQQLIASAAMPVSVKNSYGMVGTGVASAGIDRIRNVYYDNKYWKANSKVSQFETEHEQLSQLQTYLNEIGTESGYTEMISKMSKALEDLANNPSDNTARTSFTLMTDALTDMINEVANNYQITQKSINDEVELSVSEMNSLSKQIFELNQQIINIELKGGNASDLRDKRGVCLDKLAQFCDIDVVESPLMFGVGEDAVEASSTVLSVRVNGVLLVDEIEYRELMVVPRDQKTNQNDVDGLVDIYWKNPGNTPGEPFNLNQSSGRITGLLNVRDGNDGVYFNGKINGCSNAPASVTVDVNQATTIDKLNIPAQGSIILNGKTYYYDGWKAEYDESGVMNNFTFDNITYLNERNVEVSAEFAPEIIGKDAAIGKSVDLKGIPYYMTQLNELTRTFSKYMNNLTTSGVDANGEDGLDMFSALDVRGEDFVFKDSMVGSGTISSSDSSYYRLNALNWELNSAWKDDPSKVVVSYKDDIEQGNIDNKPILDKIIFGMTDSNMFKQGTVSQFLQSVTTNQAVDINKLNVFSENYENIVHVIDNQRISVSGVDTNEEAASLAVFQNLYNLSSKIISVLNEVYDKLINQTGV